MAAWSSAAHAGGLTLSTTTPWIIAQCAGTQCAPIGAWSSRTGSCGTIADVAHNQRGREGGCPLEVRTVAPRPWPRRAGSCPRSATRCAGRRQRTCRPSTRWASPPHCVPWPRRARSCPRASTRFTSMAPWRRRTPEARHQQAPAGGALPLLLRQCAEQSLP